MAQVTVAAERPTRRRFRRQLLVGAVAVGLVFLAVEAVLRLVEPHVVRAIVDIQTPSALHAKLHYLKRFAGRRVVLLGDSLVLGLSLRDAGDSLWQEHNIATLVQRRFDSDFPEQPTLVLNLAINGALPADLEGMVDAVLACEPDLIVVDLGLRGFSADFSLPAARYARPWLQPAPSVPRGPKRLVASVRRRVDRAVVEPIHSYCSALRLHDLLWQAYTGSDLRQILVHCRQSLQTAFQKSDDADALDTLDAGGQELVLKARTRFESVNLAADNPQRVAFERMLERLRASRRKTVLFYARENPDLRDQVIVPERYYDLRGELDRLIAAHLGPAMRYVPGVSTLEPDLYLDFVHVDAEGNERIVEGLWPEIEGLIRGGL
jgi:hypothetical protein